MTCFSTVEIKKTGPEAALFPVWHREKNFLSILLNHNSYNRFIIFLLKNIRIFDLRKIMTHIALQFEGFITVHGYF